MLVIPEASFCQVKKGLISSYYFTGNAQDGSRGHHGLVRGANLSSDRFGNANAAYCFDGENDYISLGTDHDLRLMTMSISMWFKINDLKTSSHNIKGNPFIFTRARNSPQYYEAYVLGLNDPTNKVGGANTSLLEDQTGCLTKNRIEVGKWYHVVYMFDSDSVYLYLNGEFQQKNYKGFFSHYYTPDSVVLGYVSNYMPDSKYYNYSWLNGCLDDLKFYGRLLSVEEIKELYQEPDPKFVGTAEPRFTREQLTELFYAYWYIPASLAVAVAALLLNMLRRRRIRRREAEKKELEHRLMQMEMKALRSQINPHFIFNAFNSIQKYILKNERDNANDYLVKFSQLMRSILELSKQELISLDEELAAIRLYLEIESMRFKHTFAYSINVSREVDQQSIRVPPLVIQPFVENAIWHGLLLKEGNKELRINAFNNDNETVVEIDDNGIGRAAAAKFKNQALHHKSFGMEITQDRLKVLNKAWGINIEFKIEDKTGPGGESFGTKIILYIRS